MEWPNLSVIIPTYNRPKILETTIRQLMCNLRYDGKISYLIGNDGDTIDAIALDEWGDILPGWGEVYVYDGPRRANRADQGIGANINMLLTSTSDDLFLQMDDDHQLMEKLDLHPQVEFLMTNQKAGWIRLYGVANHCYQASLEGEYWFVDWNSHGDYSLYIPSNRPHLKTRAFHNFFGYYPVNRTLGETEEGFCHQCRHVVERHRKYNEAHFRKGEEVIIPHVCVPLNPPVHTESGWAHVGESWQSKGE